MNSLALAVTGQRGVVVHRSGGMIAVTVAALPRELTAREFRSFLNAWKDA